MSGQKLVFKKVEGRDLYALHSEDGEVLSGQIRSELVSNPSGPPEIVARFVVHDNSGVRVDAKSGG